MDWKDQLDWQLRGVAQTKVVALGGTEAEVLQRSTNRVALVLQCVSAGPVYLAWGGQAPTNTTGVVMVLNASPLVLDVFHHGALVAQELRALGSGFGASLSVTEVLVPPP